MSSRGAVPAGTTSTSVVNRPFARELTPAAGQLFLCLLSSVSDAAELSVYA